MATVSDLVVGVVEIAGAQLLDILLSFQSLEQILPFIKLLPIHLFKHLVSLLVTQAPKNFVLIIHLLFFDFLNFFPDD